MKTMETRCVSCKELFQTKMLVLEELNKPD